MKNLDLWLAQMELEAEVWLRKLTQQMEGENAAEKLTQQMEGEDAAKWSQSLGRHAGQ